MLVYVWLILTWIVTKLVLFDNDNHNNDNKNNGQQLINCAMANGLCLKPLSRRADFLLLGNITHEICSFIIICIGNPSWEIVGAPEARSSNTNNNNNNLEQSFQIAFRTETTNKIVIIIIKIVCIIAQIIIHIRIAPMVQCFLYMGEEVEEKKERNEKNGSPTGTHASHWSVIGL